MFYSKRMRKLVIVGPHTLMQKTIAKLHTLNVLHVVEHEKTAELDIGKPLATGERIAELLLDVDMLWNALDIHKNGYAQAQQKNAAPSFKETETKVKGLAAKVSSLMSEKLALSGELSKRKQEKALLDVFKKMKLKAEDAIHPYSSLGILFGTVGKISPLLSELGNSTETEVFHALHQEKNYIALFCRKAEKETILSSLSRHGFVSVDISCLKEVKPSLQKDIDTLEAKLQDISSTLRSMNREYGYFLVAAKYSFSQEAKKALLPLKFGSTNKAFVLTGFVPAKAYEKTVSALQDETKGSLHIFEDEIKKGESIPVELENQKSVEPFQFFMDLYSLPTYKELDPSILMFITFPLFFGFMLGDIGYGLVCFLLFYGLYRAMKSKVARQLLKVMMYAALVSILFGFVYGEFFGFEEYPAAMGASLCAHSFYCVEEKEALGGHGAESEAAAGEALSSEAAAEAAVGAETVYSMPRLLSRVHEMDLLLSIAVLVGLVHLFLGFIIGFVNVYAAHGFKHAVMEKAGWMLLYPLIIKVLLILDMLRGGIASFFSSLMPNWYVLGGLAGLGVIMIVVGEGLNGAVELPGIFGNILSYARLMAIALASVGLAVVINTMTESMFAAGIVGIIGGILVFTIGHSINIALGILGPFLHSLRLHYVEFFTKFFKGGGKRYSPFGADEE